MAHPFLSQAKSTHKAKTSSIGKANNLDIPVMRAVGENSSKKLYSSSSGSMQHKDQSAASGYKRGGHVGKPKHSKPKLVIAAPADPVNPSPPDPALAAAGAVSSPAPAPTQPPMPPMKRGGRKYADGGAVDTPPPPPPPTPPKDSVRPFGRTGKESISPSGKVSGFKRGGRTKGGSDSGVGRLEQAHRQK